MRPWTFWLLIGTASAAILALACVLGRQLWCRRRSEHGTLAGIAWQFVEREESERERLAKEIQNGFGHRLVLLRNAALTALAEPGSPKGVHQALDHISRLALSALEEARQMAHRLQPAEVDRVGFAKAVEDLLARLLVPRGVSVFQDLDGLEASFAKP